MAIESDNDRLLFLQDFGTTVTLPDASTITAIFDNEFVSVDPATGQVISSLSPNIVCRTADIPALTNADQITINATVYEVKDIQEDGTGMSVVELYKVA